MQESLLKLWYSTGFANIEIGQLVMMLIALGLMFLAIRKGFEPLLLLPIGFGALLSNIPGAGLSLDAAEYVLKYGTNEAIESIRLVLDGVSYKEASYELQHLAQEAAMAIGYDHGFIHKFYLVAIGSGVAPLLIFIGVGAMTDFGPLLANPKMMFLGAAAQFGIFTTLLGALALNSIPGFGFTLSDASAIAIIGGADGPTAIFLASRLAPDLLGAIAVAAYSYMALVPIIQPPIMRLLTTKEERGIVMSQLRVVSHREKILFPIAVLLLCAFFLPDAAPLIGCFCLGNLMRESGVVDRLSKTAQNELINIVTIFLGLSVGSKLSADKFLSLETLGILALGAAAFSVGTAAGLMMAKLMGKFSKEPINPLVGAAGVSAVPMAARVVNKLGLEANSQNFLLMHAMGPNVAGVIGSAVAAGVLLAIVGG
ncbi:sodium ion-translocating decarboxylase subunit beta [Pelagibaculum spongiae]|uniref:Oxaloacetate decarboxylase beta chain n=1 Tax=Pelagibaculum spongiae TaxID=2080658 RepID=A0A2V1H398_9GAMM|nr:sodium ion-translocating decarboxylase subunit beta [Pelagibaculum spongiae]PVZ69777.1 oxaloacetate decarboxylase subunit beta [Pelagibaculum spongiae]